MESLNLQVVAVLIPLEIKHHTVPHLKALTCSIECRGGHGHGSTFKQCYTVMKSTILLHKRPKQWFHVTVAVHIVFFSCNHMHMSEHKASMAINEYQNGPY